MSGLFNLWALSSVGHIAVTGEPDPRAAGGGGAAGASSALAGVPWPPLAGRAPTGAPRGGHRRPRARGDGVRALRQRAQRGQSGAT
eukprot:1183759-Prorocentrum_minimum.AAC.2